MLIKLSAAQPLKNLFGISAIKEAGKRVRIRLVLAFQQSFLIYFRNRGSDAVSYGQLNEDSKEGQMDIEQAKYGIFVFSNVVNRFYVVTDKD